MRFRHPKFQSNPLEDAEAEAIAEEQFSEARQYFDYHKDQGDVDEEILSAEGTEQGAGALFKPNDSKHLGFHIEEIG